MYSFWHASHQPDSMPSCSWTFARRRAQRQTYPCWRAGLPKTSACGGTSLVTTDPAPIKANSPIVMPQIITDPAPIDAPYFTSVGVISQSSALLSLPSGVMARGKRSGGLPGVVRADLRARSGRVRVHLGADADRAQDRQVVRHRVRATHRERAEPRVAGRRG